MEEVDFIRPKRVKPLLKPREGLPRMDFMVKKKVLTKEKKLQNLLITIKFLLCGFSQIVASLVKEARPKRSIKQGKKP